MSERPEFTREARRTIAAESPLNPLSLVGSHAFYDGEGGCQQALVVGEPQPGVYLLEFADLVTDEPTFQRIVKLDELTSEFWHFYDSKAGIRRAIQAMFR